VPQETTLVARQVGGKPLGADSPLWKTLFPSDILRIEGRVPVDNSIKYLVQMRMNSSKELYAVAFVPAGPQDESDFKTFNNFLISKRFVLRLMFDFSLSDRNFFLVDTVSYFPGEADPRTITLVGSCTWSHCLRQTPFLNSLNFWMTLSFRKSAPRTTSSGCGF